MDQKPGVSRERATSNPQRAKIFFFLAKIMTYNTPSCPLHQLNHTPLHQAVYHVR